VERVWQEFWKPIVAPDGTLDVEQVKRELFDYHTTMENVPLVYDEITGGRISKQNTLASAVIGEYNAHLERMLNDDCDVTKTQLRDAVKTFSHEKRWGLEEIEARMTLLALIDALPIAEGGSDDL
jgi:hypothetical protein